LKNFKTFFWWMHRYLFAENFSCISAAHTN